MKIAIYGAGYYGRYIYDEIQNQENSKVSAVCWIDNYIGECDICGLPVYTEKEFMSEHVMNKVDAVIVAMEKARISQEITTSLLLQGYNQIYLVPANSYKTKLPVLDQSGNFSPCIKYYKKVKPSIHFMEVLITKHCNLNCKRCAHFSNINTKNTFLDLNEYESYLIQLRNKFDTISLFQLIGGEPLLNPQLDDYVSLAGKYLPDSRIEIMTNGTLLLKMPRKLIDAIVQYKVYVRITQYPPIRRNLLQILDFLEKEGIRYVITPPMTHFDKVLTLKEKNGEQAFEKYRIIECICHGIEGGRIYLCPTISRLYDVQDFLGIHIEEEELFKSSIDLMSDDIDGWDILKYFSHPTPLCRFCSPERECLPWETGKPEKEDWINF